MTNFFDLEVHASYRHEQLLREAAEHRLLRLARAAAAQDRPRAPLRVLAWAGRHLARWGARLQPGGAPPAAGAGSAAGGAGRAARQPVGAGVAAAGC